uniref:Ribosomal protein L23 n=1 Tax=Amorphochlora amoebiformis TaxID=1561963 RepID=A0A0H5BLU0_9EUKA|nr:ribosomal protein L23 [Amorphochlora amoebiformis]
MSKSLKLIRRKFFFTYNTKFKLLLNKYNNVKIKNKSLIINGSINSNKIKIKNFLIKYFDMVPKKINSLTSVKGEKRFFIIFNSQTQVEEIIESLKLNPF